MAHLERLPSGRKRAQRLSYLLDPPGAAHAGHAQGLNSLAAANEGALLFTASRDTTIRRWAVGAAASASRPPTLSCQAVLEGHADWVTSLALLTPGPRQLLLSGGCDGAVALWAVPPDSDADPRTPQAPLASFQRHGDYITSLSAAPGADCFASAGLGGELLLWDAGSCRTLARGGAATVAPQQLGAPPRGGAPSLYALSLAPSTSPSSPLLLSGDAEGGLRLWDTRAPYEGGGGGAELRAHGDAVRCCILDGPRLRAASAGAGGALLLWDLRALGGGGVVRPLARVDCHGGESVWAMCGEGGGLGGGLWSGDRAGGVWRTDLGSGAGFFSAPMVAPVAAAAAQPVAMDTDENGGEGEEEEPGAAAAAAPSFPPSRSLLTARAPSAITSLLHLPSSSGGGSLWVATPAPEALCFPAQPSSSTSSSRPSQPIARTASLPGGGLRRARLLPDRRSVAVQDAAGAGALWDLVASARVAPLGAFACDAEGFERCAEAASEAAKLRANHQGHSSPSLSSFLAPWCSVDARHGSLAVHLEPGSAFGAYVLRRELFPATAGSEAGAECLNFGEEAVKNILRAVAAPPPAAAAVAQPEMGGRAESGPTLSPSDPPLFPFPSPPPALIFEASAAPGGGRRRCDAAEGVIRLGLAPELPVWAHDAALFGRSNDEKEKPKSAAFLVQPAEGSAYPALSESCTRCAAPRCTLISAVEGHVARELARLRVPARKGGASSSSMETEGAGGEGEAAAAAGEREAEEEEEEAAPRVEVLCGEVRLRRGWTLAEVHALAWVPQGVAGEMVLLYREASE